MDTVASAVNESVRAENISAVSVVGDIVVPVCDNEVVPATRVGAEALTAIRDAASYAIDHICIAIGSQF